MRAMNERMLAEFLVVLSAAAEPAVTAVLSLTAYLPVPGTLMVTEVESLETTEIPVVVATPSSSIITPS